MGVRYEARAVPCEVGESEVRREAGYIHPGGEQTSSPAIPELGSLFTDGVGGSIGGRLGE